LYYLQLSLQAASPETFGYTLVFFFFFFFFLLLLLLLLRIIIYVVMPFCLTLCPVLWTLVLALLLWKQSS